MKKIALVLGGGGARCFTELGFIKVLQENNINIDFIVACSSGSLIGSLIANGVEVEDIRNEFHKAYTMLKWFKPNITRKGILSQKGIQFVLNQLLDNKLIENSKIPLQIVATNISKGELKVFKSGKISDAVCASSAVQGLYNPVKIDGDYYVDGALLNSIPADIARKEIGKENTVVVINLDTKLNNKDFNVKNTFQILYRCFYIPLLINRAKIIQENADIVVEPYKNLDLSFGNWLEILKFASSKKLNYFYDIGIKEGLKYVKLIKEKNIN